MALKQRDDSLKYIRIKAGKIYVGKDLETPYDEIEGTIQKMYYKDEEYEGTPQRKLIMRLSDGKETYQLGINCESSSYSSLMGFLPNVDIAKTLTLHPRSETINREGNDITRNSILVSQEGKFAKSYFTKDDNHGMPRWEVVVVGKKKVTDKSAFLEFLENFVNKEIIPKLSVENTPPVVVKEEEPTVEGTDKLPWE